jgi:possible restriction enzyme, beta subunit
MMKRLTEKEWKPIKIIDIFETVKPGKISRANQFEKVSNGGVNYIAATNRNNGVLYHLEPSEDLKKKVQAGNCIGFIKDGDGSAGYAIYKHEPFASTVNVIYGYADWLNRENGLFFVAAQDMIEDKYSHGYKRNLQHLRGDKVMLPVDDKGNPDYAYMTLYSTEVRGRMLMRYKNFIAGQLSQLEHKDIPALDEKEWKKFKAFGDDGILDIATTSSSIDGIRLKDGQTKTLPYVTRTDNSNGIARFVSSDNLSYGYDDAGCITVGLDTQTAFWQPHDFVTGQNIQIISGKRLNQYLAQFIVPLLRSQMTAKFNWGGNGATLGRMKRLEIMLPVTDAGMPDYKYMEQYTKNMMLKKYEQYLAFIDR